MSTATCTGMTQDEINELIAKRVDEALKANPKTEVEIKNYQQDNHDEENVNNGNSNGNGNGNPNVNNGETVFHISNCPPRYQVKYASCTLMDGALTWWNSHKITVGVDAAYAMTWKALMKQMTEVYYPRNEIQKMEMELWSLTVKSNELTSYNQRFQELTLLCSKMVLKEEDKVEKYIGGLPDSIQGNVIAVEPGRLQDAIRIANNLMDQKLKGYAIKNAENKRRAYTVGNNVERKGYARVLPYCSKCRMHHEGPCMAKCGNCKRVGHMTRDCRTTIAATPQRAPNHENKTGNKTGNNEAKARAYVIGGGAGPDSNVITGTFLLNNRYATMLFDSGADRSFVSTTLSTLLNVIPSTLDTSYAVELADGRISETNVILRGCTLGLLGHPFKIDLMPVELGSFDVIVGMDWLAKHHAVIICDERNVHISYGDEVLIIEGDGCKGGITAKDSNDKSEEKRLEDVPIVRDFPEVFPEDLPGLPPARQVEFQIELVPGSSTVKNARVVHSLARTF
ncbi:putative reverse transcriptase domain-containing protein [Tanacetum coccineum]